MSLSTPKILALLGVGLITAGGIQASIVIEQTVSTDYLSDTFNYQYGMPETGDSWGFTPEVVGLQKFNPALGTLNKISFRFTGILELNTEVTVTLSEGGSFGVDFFPSRDAEVGVWYEPSNGGGFLEETAVDHIYFQFVIEDSTEEGGTFNYFGDSWTSDELLPYENLMDSPGFYASDFIGTGEVEGLRAGFFAPETGLLDFYEGPVENISMVLEAVVMEAQFVLEYHYTPVPEPSTSILVAGLVTLGAVVVIRRRRTKGKGTGNQ